MLGAKVGEVQVATVADASTTRPSATERAYSNR
jgi:hypothetical protein